jgi:tryptophanyl-tRNA synthetase
MAEMKRLLTGIQPSGKLHIGNYFGALKPLIDHHGDYETFLIVVDYHALTTVRDPRELQKNIFDATADYIAAGVDPKEVTMFQQSEVSAHTELAWIFECLVTVPFLMQAHAYKDKTTKGLEANAGLFNYPMLMAADILLYDADVVPVGEDQRQHVEYTREAATKFNNAYGKTFTMPKEEILKNTGIIPGTDGQKMSKSYKNTIPLFGTRDEIASSVMSIMTDSVGVKPEHVFAIHRLYKNEKELEALYEESKGNYKTLKEALIEDIDSFIAPMREKRDALTKDPTSITKILKEGAEKARVVANAKMKAVREKVGVTL